DFLAVGGLGNAENFVVVAGGGHAEVALLGGSSHCGIGPMGPIGPILRTCYGECSRVHDTAATSGFASSFSSVMSTSVVSIRPATLAALMRAVFATSAASMMPALTRSVYSPVA